MVNRVRLERALESTTGNDLNILWVNGGSCSAFIVSMQPGQPQGSNTLLRPRTGAGVGDRGAIFISSSVQRGQ